MSDEVINSKKIVFIQDNKVKLVFDTNPMLLGLIVDNAQIVDITAFENASQINAGDIYDPSTNTITVVERSEFPTVVE
jgi:hypothetical protein